jgi:hypothetical protein
MKELTGIYISNWMFATGLMETLIDIKDLFTVYFKVLHSSKE